MSDTKSPEEIARINQALRTRRLRKQLERRKKWLDDAQEGYIEAGGTLAEQQPADNISHTDDFRYVCWFGGEYAFTPMQAACVQTLWRAWEQGTPEMGQPTILETAGSSGTRLSDVFDRGKKGMHPAWGTMIVPGGTKGSYRLAARPV